MNKDLCSNNIFAHFQLIKIRLMSFGILNLFVDTFIVFLKREVIIISLWIENIAVLHL